MKHSPTSSHSITSMQHRVNDTIMLELAPIDSLPDIHGAASTNALTDFVSPHSIAVMVRAPIPCAHSQSLSSQSSIRDDPRPDNVMVTLSHLQSRSPTHRLINSHMHNHCDAKMCRVVRCNRRKVLRVGTDDAVMPCSARSAVDGHAHDVA